MLCTHGTSRRARGRRFVCERPRRRRLFAARSTGFDVVAKPRQHPQQLIDRTRREASLKQRRQIRLRHFQQRGCLAGGQPTMLSKSVDAYCYLRLCEFKLRLGNAQIREDAVGEARQDLDS